MENIVRDKYKKITRLLIEKKLKISTMESASSGLVASLITDTEGASAIFQGAFITYSNEAKIKQGVLRETIELKGVYSEETAREMASACRRAYASDIGIGVTGTFGNIDTANKDSVKGEVYFAIDFNGELSGYKRILDKQSSRYLYKLACANEIAEELLKKL